MQTATVLLTTAYRPKSEIDGFPEVHLLQGAPQVQKKAAMHIIAPKTAAITAPQQARETAAAGH